MLAAEFHSGGGAHALCIRAGKVGSGRAGHDRSGRVAVWCGAGNLRFVPNEVGDTARARMLVSLAGTRVHFDAGRFKDKHAFRIAYQIRKSLLTSAEAGLVGKGLVTIVSNRLLDAGYCAQLRALPPPD